MLLQTAHGTVCSVDKARSAHLHILFYLGSQLSFISLYALLNLQTIGNADINIKVFGGQQAIKTVNRVQLFAKNREQTLNTYFVYNICEFLSG